MIHIVVTTGRDYNWRFVIDPLDRNLDVEVPNLDNADVEFGLALAAQIAAWKCRKAGIARNMLNGTGFVDNCPGEPALHVMYCDTEGVFDGTGIDLELICRWLLIDWEEVKCKLPSMISR